MAGTETQSTSTRGLYSRTHIYICTHDSVNDNDNGNGNNGRRRRLANCWYWWPSDDPTDGVRLAVISRNSSMEATNCSLSCHVIRCYTSEMNISIFKESVE